MLSYGLFTDEAVDLVLDLALPAAAKVAVDDARLEVHDVLQVLNRQRGDLFARHGGDVARETELDDRTPRAAR